MKIEINIQNRHFLVILLFIIAASAIGLVVAYGGTTPSVMGHSWGEMVCDNTLCANPVNGKVGIGTQNPTEKLEVNGNIKVMGGIKSNGLEVGGGIRLNTSTSKPTCDANTRGMLWYEKGTTNNDQMYECLGSLAQQCCTAAAGSPCAVTCPAGGVIKSIDVAAYGSDYLYCSNSPSCPDGGPYTCTNPPSSCIGQPSCTFTFSDAVCGSPCYWGNKKGVLKVTCTIPSIFSWQGLAVSAAGLGSTIPASTTCSGTTTTLLFNSFTVYQNRWAVQYNEPCYCDSSGYYRYYFGNDQWSSCISVNCGACPYIPPY